MSETRHAQVAVLGGGISGLGVAHYLVQAGMDVVLIEKSARVGGTIETRRVGRYLVESGPNSGLETTPLLRELFGSVGIAPGLCYAAPAARNRYVVRGGRLRALPTGPGAFVKSPLFSGGAKLRLLREPFIARNESQTDETIAAFVRRRLGGEFLDYAVNPFVAGVYAGEPERLSLRSSFPKLYELEQKHGSLIRGTIKGARERRRRQTAGETSRAAARMFSFTGGMQTIVDGLAASLGDRIETGATPLSVEPRGDGYAINIRSESSQWTLACDAVVFAIPSHAYGEIDVALGTDLPALLSRIDYPPVSVVVLGYDSWPPDIPLDGFGFLVPEKERREILGTIWNSTLFPDRAPEGGACLTTFVGGSRQPHNARLDDGALVDLVRRDLRDLMGITRDPDTAVVRRWERAIPQYNVGHSRILAAIEGFEARCPGVYISGNFRGGVSVSDCIRQAQAMAERVVANTRVAVNA